MFKQLVILLALAISRLSNASPDFDPSLFQIEQIINGGNGCPQGSVSATLAPDASAFSILYNEFRAAAGGQAPPTANSTCNVKVKIKTPPGWALEIQAADFRGYLFLSPSVRAEQRINIGHGAKEAGFGIQSWDGPFDGEYVVSKIAPDVAISAGCGNGKSMIDLKTKIKLSGGAPSREGLMTVDSADGNMVQRYRVAWRKCANF